MRLLEGPRGELRGSRRVLKGIFVTFFNVFECFRGRYLPGTLVSRALATASDRCSGSVTLYSQGRSLFPRVGHFYDCFDAGFVTITGYYPRVLKLVKQY